VLYFEGEVKKKRIYYHSSLSIKKIREIKSNKKELKTNS